MLAQYVQFWMFNELFFPGNLISVLCEVECWVVCGGVNVGASCEIHADIFAVEKS